MADPMRGVFQGFDISASALRAEMQRAQIVSANLGNLQSVGNSANPPYRRHSVIFEEVLENVHSLDGVRGAGKLATGVAVARVYEDHGTPFREVYDPGHELADERGYILTTNVDLFKELVDMSMIERSYQANLAAMRVYRTMLQTTVANMGRT